MTQKWIRFHAISFITLVLLSAPACFVADQKIPQINACTESFNLESLKCVDQTDKAQSILLKNLLKRCDGRLQADGVLPLTSYQLCQRELVTQYAALQASDCQKVFVDHTRCVLKKNLIKEVSILIQPEIQHVDGTTQNTGRVDHLNLHKFLNNLGAWYNETLLPIYQSQALHHVKSQGVAVNPTQPRLEEASFLQELADQDQREIIDALWAAIIASTKSDEILQRHLDFYSKNEASLQVAAGAILQPAYPAPLLMRLLGHSLKTLSDRVYYLAEITDLGCSIHSCRGNTNTELFKIIALLGSLGNKTEFQQLSSSIEHIHPSLRSLFQQISRNIDSIEQNVSRFIQKQGGNLRNPEILTVNLSSVPTFAQGLLEIIQANRILKQSYVNSGFYSWTKSGVTEFGFSTNLDAITQVATLTQTQFERQWTKFKSNRSDYGQKILAQRNWENSVERIQAESQKQLERIAEIGEDLNGLRASLSQAHQRMSDYLTNIFNVLNSASYLTRYGSSYRTEREFIPFFITPQSAPAYAKSSTMRDLGIQTAPAVRLNKGQIASIRLDGQWAPTCALRRSGYKGESVSGALIGPEGYMMSVSEGKAKVHSVLDYKREDRTARDGASLSLCHKASLGIIGVIFGQQPSITVCAETSYGQSNSNGRNTDDVDSTETRQQAAFNLGIRSAASPFEKFPAGSLLIAQVKQGQTGKENILSVEVAQRTNQVLAQDDVDLYFIVNDCKDALSLADQGLQVHMEIKTQESALAQQVARAMVESIQHVHEKIDAILLQGDVSPLQMNTLREFMFMKLAESSQGRARANLGPVLSEFYQFWVENELLEIEKKSRIRRLERNLRNELSNLKRIEADLERTQQLEKLYALQKLWALDSLDIRQFTQDLKSAVDTLNRYIIPVIAFQAPDRIIALKNQPSVRFFRDQLTVNTSVDDIADQIKNLYTDLITSEGLSQLVFRGWQQTEVVISFPNPDLANTVPENPRPGEGLTLWKKGSRVMAERLWSSLISPEVGAPVTLSLTLEDLYSRDLPNTLACSHLSPVIESMGLYFVTPEDVGEPGTEYGFNLGFQASNAMIFPAETRLQNFALVGDSMQTWLGQTVPYAVGPGRNALSVLTRARINPQTGTGSAAGLSPLMDFNFDLSDLAFKSGGGLAHYKPSIREILVVMKLKYRPSTVRSVNWIPACAGRT